VSFGQGNFKALFEAMAGAGELRDTVSQADTLYAKGARWAPFVVRADRDVCPLRTLLPDGAG
jgi:hypothetical protein